MSDLASQTALTPSGLTRAIDRLSHAGAGRSPGLPRGPAGSLRGAYRRWQGPHGEALEIHRAQLAELLDGALEPDEERALVSGLRKLRDRVNPGAAVLTAGDEAEEGATR